jgi:hypothetical protein
VLGPGGHTIDLMLGLGWVINLAIAEVVIRRQTRTRRSRRTTARVVA